MTVSGLVDDFPLAGRRFAKWFASSYRLGENVYNDAPLSDQLITINRFLGYECSLSDKESITEHKEKVLNRFKFYEESLQNKHDIITFDEYLIGSGKDNLIEMFEKDRKTGVDRLSIKDSLVELEQDKVIIVQGETNKASEIEDNDDFWAKLKPSTDVPF